jgi:flagellar basal-body rod protein FlgB
MELFDPTQLGLERAISGAEMRQSALAANVANANTPGYKPKDIDFHSALRAAFATGSDVSKAEITETESSTQMRADGSGIDIDVESSKLAANGLEYQALIQAAKGRIDIIESAMGTR